MSNALIVDEIDGSVIVRFNRPEIRSPLSIEVLDSLKALVAKVGDRSDVQRLIFTGVGDVFASGADLREIAGVEPTEAAGFARRGQVLMQQIADLAVPTVAAVNGICFGGALDLALSCDRRIASRNAIFAHPGADLGIITGWGGTQRLPRLVSRAVALEMFFAAKRLSAEEAFKVGLVDAIADDLVERALTA